MKDEKKAAKKPAKAFSTGTSGLLGDLQVFDKGLM